MNTSSQTPGNPEVNPFDQSTFPPRQRLYVMLNCVIDCCERAKDVVQREGRLDDPYISRQLNIAYGKILDAMVLDLDPTQDIDCSEAGRAGAEAALCILRNEETFLPHQSTGERRGS